MRKIAISLATAIMVSTSNLNAGIPVIDGAANALAQLQLTTTIKEYAEEAIRYTEQLNTWKQETIDRAKEYYAKTGIKDAVKNFEDAYNLYQDISDEIVDIVETAQSFGKLEFSEEAIGIAKEVFGSDTCKAGKLADKVSDEKLQYQCLKAHAGTFERIRILSASAKDIEKDINELNKLSQKLKNSTDIKETTDIANAIKVTQGRIQEKQKYTKIGLDLITENEKIEKEKYEIAQNKAMMTPSLDATKMNFRYQ